jgi:hypothetical protein
VQNLSSGLAEDIRSYRFLKAQTACHGERRRRWSVRNSTILEFDKGKKLDIGFEPGIMHRSFTEISRSHTSDHRAFQLGPMTILGRQNRIEINCLQGRMFLKKWF